MRTKTSKVVAVLATTILLITMCALPCFAESGVTESANNTFVGFIVDLGQGIKNAFNAFTFDENGNVTAEFECVMAYFLIACAVAVIVGIFKLITERRHKKL